MTPCVEKLPTHIAHVCRRLEFSHKDDPTESFFETSYLAEVSIKTIAIALVAALAQPAKELNYRLGYRLVRADGLGDWDQSIRDASAQQNSAYLSREFQGLTSWLTKKRKQVEDEAFRNTMADIRIVLSELGIEDSEGGKKDSVTSLITALVQIRNRTKGHGALGQAFYARANSPYTNAVSILVESCPVFAWKWIRFSIQDSGSLRAVELRGLTPRHLPGDKMAAYTIGAPGIYFIPDQSQNTVFCGQFLRTNYDCTSFFLPNGGAKDNGRAQFIDYGKSEQNTEEQSIEEFLVPPAPPPPSETQGMPAFDVQGNVIGNVPALPQGYVCREDLESDLTRKLQDNIDRIITLHGGGGMGKTSLALRVVHDLGDPKDAPFEHQIWFSARDIDLGVGGPIDVRPDVTDLPSAAKYFCNLFPQFKSYKANEAIDCFARALQAPEQISPSGKGTLFILDNFETMSDLRGLYQFLHEHTRFPNKVLITTRSRDKHVFKGDWPVEVTGMKRGEAKEMLVKLGEDLRIPGLMTNEVIEKIYDSTKGHAYVMRIIAGEMAKEGRYTPLSQVMVRRDDVIDAVFERSFNKLSDAARTVFLTLAGWKSKVPEISLLVVLGIRGIDVMSGIEECQTLSLVLVEETLDGQRCYSVPHLARLFGQKKLGGDPDGLVIDEDLRTLQRFGAIQLDRQDQTQDRLLDRLVQTCLDEIAKGSTATARADKILEALANIYPSAWMWLANFRKLADAEDEKISYALRRATEEHPYDKKTWLARADFAQKISDDLTLVSSLLRAVEIDPEDVSLISKTALKLANYIGTHKTEIPLARRGAFLASVRTRMEQISEKLDATGLSNLAWLFLLENKRDKAKYYANKGFKLDDTNPHCRKLLEHLDQEMQPTTRSNKRFRRR